MATKIHKAVILAAGKGTRMAELTAQAPKPMLVVRGKPILEHVADRLEAAGAARLLVVVGYYGDQIRAFFAGRKSMEFREQQEVNGTATAALLGREFAGPDPFLLTFGDILAAPGDYLRMMALLEDGVAGVLAVKHTEDPYRGAAVYERDGVVRRIVEKPPRGSSTTPWNSAGIYVFRPEVFEELARVPVSPRGEYELTSAVSQMVEAGREVRMCAVSGDWLDVGRPEDLAAAEGILGA
ncbi:MAG: sugar phosphate nucleotidyltransferase [Bryobacteraceae bacterium]|nr:sugar phosphate nucleotidyltransferase [Bryobacteraceae bacterium]